MLHTSSVHMFWMVYPPTMWFWYYWRPPAATILIELPSLTNYGIYKQAVDSSYCQYQSYHSRIPRRIPNYLLAQCVFHSSSLLLLLWQHLCLSVHSAQTYTGFAARVARKAMHAAQAWLASWVWVWSILFRSEILHDLPLVPCTNSLSAAPANPCTAINPFLVCLKDWACSRQWVVFLLSRWPNGWSHDMQLIDILAYCCRIFGLPRTNSRLVE